MSERYETGKLTDRSKKSLEEGSTVKTGLVTSGINLSHRQTFTKLFCRFSSIGTFRCHVGGGKKILRKQTNKSYNTNVGEGKQKIKGNSLESFRVLFKP